MDRARFDAWTRRRVGLSAGALTLALIGVAPADAPQAKKKRKKRCKKLGDTCTLGGKRKCCRDLQCDAPKLASPRCCKPLQAPCTDNTECCSGDCEVGFCEPVM